MDLQEQYDRLLRYCYSKTKDRFAAEDITQETLLRFWQSKSYKDTGKELAYLYTIARNLCTDEFRRPRHADIESCDPGVLKSCSGASLLCGDPDEHLLRQELGDALNRLPEDQREIVILRFASEVPVSDIGRMLGLSRFSVRRRIKEGLSALRKMMEEDREI